MTLIEIDKRTIRKNPNAGRTHYSVPAQMEITGTCYGELPVWLKDKIYITSHYHPLTPYDEPEIEFMWDGEITKNHLEAIKCTKKPRLTINIEQHYAHVESMVGEREYFYEYKNPKVECDNCGNLIHYKSIESVDDYEGYSHDKCPLCMDIDTFDYKLQDVKDALI